MEKEVKPLIRKSSIILISIFIAVLIDSNQLNVPILARQDSPSYLRTASSGSRVNLSIPLSIEIAAFDELPDSIPAGSGGSTRNDSLALQQNMPLTAPSISFLAWNWVPSMGFLTPLSQAVSVKPLVADGQFVWGPNVGKFNIQTFLESRHSDLAAYAEEIDLWASYTSVNPKILLAVLELRYGMVDRFTSDSTPEEVRASIQATAEGLAIAFYTHLHSWGARGALDPAIQALPEPELVFTDGTVAVLQGDVSSGSYAIAAHLSESTTMQAWNEEIDAQHPDGFMGVFENLFPDVDLLAETNDIIPPDLPPDDLFQLPFPLGATWSFGGPHSWHGDNTRPFSSMDFSAGGGTCAAPPKMYTVASASGSADRPNQHDCWLEIDHAGGWTSSYYHLQRLIDPQGTEIYQNTSLGKIACEICAGGWSNGPHLHWSVKYNGAYVSLEGIKISGWIIHVGPVAYSSGSIERGGITLNPWSTVLNDYYDYFPKPNRSLQFYGNGVDDIDRVKILLGDPRRPVNVGGSNFTIEWWMKANSGENSTVGCTTGNDQWILGSIILDRDVFGSGDHGDYGISLMNGRIAFGVNDGTTGETLCGTTDITDGNWHHIAVTREKSSGLLRLFIDGLFEAEIVGPTGNISYNVQRTPGYPNDPYLVIGAEKHDAGEAFPSYSGWIDELRLSKNLRYTTNFSIPTAPFATDPTTVALYHFDEGSGKAVNDSSGYPGGPSNGVRMYGGSPAGPKWSPDIPFVNIKPDLTKNGSFERDSDGDGVPNSWNTKGTTMLDKRICTLAHSGSCSYQMTGEALNKHLRQTIIQSGDAGDVLSLSAWSMSSDAKGGGLYAVRLTIRYEDGTKETWKVRYSNGSNPWQRRDILATTAKPYDKIMIYLDYRKSQGQVWFDDVSLVKQ
jgi:hypothetical protein